MVTISEERFFDACDKVDNVRSIDFPYEYVPSIEELKCLKIEENTEQHIEYLLYLRNHPIHTEKSGELAKYIRKLLRDNMSLTE